MLVRALHKAKQILKKSLPQAGPLAVCACEERSTAGCFPAALCCSQRELGAAVIGYMQHFWYCCKEMSCICRDMLLRLGCTPRTPQRGSCPAQAALPAGGFPQDQSPSPITVMCGSIQASSRETRWPHMPLCHTTSHLHHAAQTTTCWILSTDKCSLSSACQIRRQQVSSSKGRQLC